jgi:hypothetical protein
MITKLLRDAQGELVKDVHGNVIITPINELVVVRADDWEGLFVNGELVDEMHKLGEGIGYDHVALYVKDRLEEYEPCILTVRWVTEDYYDNVLSQVGSFPRNLSEVELDDA